MNWILTGAFLVSAISFLKGDRICPVVRDNEEGILFPDKTNCSRYYECNWDEEILMECPEGLHFNPREDVCDWPENAKCNNYTANSEQIIIAVKENNCPSENPPVDVLLPHESDCAKFYKCNHGRAVEQNCPEGLRFNREMGYCDWPWNVECPKQLDSIQNDSDSSACPFEYNGTDVLLPDPKNCSKFLHCDHGQPVPKDCPAGLYFNTETDRCDWPWNVQCNSSASNQQTTTPNDYTTQEVYNANCPLENTAIDIVFPHKNNNTWFYKCNHGNLELHSCPVGLHFNVNTNNCNWPIKSYCSYLRQLANETPKCSGKYSFIPDERDCQRFWICLDGLPQFITCPPDLYFNPESNNCEELEDISCWRWDYETI